tara:strand:+ start:308 stop:544 length:237 start_codon:yes stop_codon:yes gene_type:complete
MQSKEFTELVSKRKPRKCSRCGSAKIASISYGYPTEEAVKMEEEGKIVFGGCCEEIDAAKWQCIDCGVQIYRKLESEN